MALSIKDTQTDKLARELAKLTGESITEAIYRSLYERISKINGDRDLEKRKKEILGITARFREGLDGDILSDEEMYDEIGLPRE